MLRFPPPGNLTTSDPGRRRPAARRRGTGIGFVISSDTVTNIARQLVTSGHVTRSGRAALGVQVTTVTAPSGTPAGAAIDSVTPGGPAAKAGLRPGDVITAVKGMATPGTQSPFRRARRTAPRTSRHGRRHPPRRHDQHRARHAEAAAIQLDRAAAGGRWLRRAHHPQAAPSAGEKHVRSYPACLETNPEPRPPGRCARPRGGSRWSNTRPGMSPQSRLMPPS